MQIKLYPCYRCEHSCASVFSNVTRSVAPHVAMVFFADRPHGDQSNTEHTPRRERPSERRHRRPHESGHQLATNGFDASSSLVVVTMATPLGPASRSVTGRSPATIDLSPRSNSPYRSGASSTTRCCWVTLVTPVIVATWVAVDLRRSSR